MLMCFESGSEECTWLRRAVRISRCRCSCRKPSRSVVADPTESRAYQIYRQGILQECCRYYWGGVDDWIWTNQLVAYDGNQIGRSRLIDDQSYCDNYASVRPIRQQEGAIGPKKRSMAIQGTISRTWHWIIRSNRRMVWNRSGWTPDFVGIDWSLVSQDEGLIFRNTWIEGAHPDHFQPERS